MGHLMTAIRSLDSMLLAFVTHTPRSLSLVPTLNQTHI